MSFTKSRILLVVLGLSLIVAVTIGVQTLLSLPPVEQDMYSWNQKVTLTLETEDGVFSSSTVQRITWHENSAKSFNPAAASWIPVIEGEMPILVFSDVIIISTFESHSDNNFMARALLQKGTDNGLSASRLSKIRNSSKLIVELDQHDYKPYILSVKSPQSDPLIELIDPSIVTVSVELTDEDVSFSMVVDEKMPWLKEASRSPGYIEKTQFFTGSLNSRGRKVLGSFRRSSLHRRAN